MKRKIWSGLTAALLTTTLSTATSGHAEPTHKVASNSDAGLPAAEIARSSREPKLHGESNPGKSAAQQPQPNAQAAEAIKVGEYQASDSNDWETIAKVQPHELTGRQAVTLYVQNIPVLTFLGADAIAKSDTKVGETEATRAISLTQTKTIQPQVTASPSLSDPSNPAHSSSQTRSTPTTTDAASDPLRRATTVAAKLNRLHRDGIDAKTITVLWKENPDASGSARERYIIKTGDEELVELNANTILPDTTRNLAKDALQATNRLRRLMGQAPPLQQISGRPQSTRAYKVAIGSRYVRNGGTGMASWYGPGFHGNRSASGEIFNQNAMTAAHRRLPFGTSVRVTNLNNGRSVIVRINDRGPYAHGRVIDLSAAAARVLGMMGSGVAPVRLDILSPAQ